MQAGAGEGVAAGGFHLNLLSTQLHACQLSVCVCSSLWPKAMSGLWPKCLPVCDFYGPAANRQSSASIDASISPSTSHLLHEMLLY